MIEAIVMIAAGFAVLYWAFWVSRKSSEPSSHQPDEKHPDKV
jgi:hypothetical protein